MKNIITTIFIYIALTGYTNASPRCQSSGSVCNTTGGDFCSLQSGEVCKVLKLFQKSHPQMAKLKVIFSHKHSFIHFLNQVAEISKMPQQEERFLHLSELLDPEERYMSFKEAFTAKLTSFDFTPNEIKGILKIYFFK